MTGGEVQCGELLRGGQPLLSQGQARARGAVLPTRHQARCPVCVLMDVVYSSGSNNSVQYSVAVVCCIRSVYIAVIYTIHYHTMYIVYKHYTPPLTLHQRLSHWYTASCQPGP